MAGLAALVVLAASCASQSPTVTTDEVSSGSATVAGADDTTPEDGPGSLVAPLLGGGTFDLASELSSAPVALWFWAPG